jgi:phytoene dehydrogenase-like protein
MSKLVIGAGRSGIAAASFLARQGHLVTLSDLKCPDVSKVGQRDSA